MSSLPAIIIAAALLSLAACALPQPQAPKRDILAASPRELMPHADRDHFVFLYQTIANGQPIGKGVEVEHVSAVDAPDEFEVSSSQDGTPIGSSRLRDDGKSIWLLSENADSLDMRLVYDPPLRLLSVPLKAGEVEMTAGVDATRLSSGESLGRLSTHVVVRLGEGHTRLHFGDPSRAVAFDVLRTLEGKEGTLRFDARSTLLPGIGEVESEVVFSNGVQQRRELVCAIVGGRLIGDCKELARRLEALPGGAGIDPEL